MKILTKLEIQTTPINFKVNHTTKEYKYFKLVEYVGWIKKQSKKYPVYRGYCKNCNAEVIIAAKVVTDNSQKSCGCSRKKIFDNKTQDITNPAFTRLYAKYKRGAEDRKLSFKIELQEFYELTQQNCYYCNRAPFQVAKNNLREFRYNGIDRKNNTIGYTKLNCVACCGKCNMMKWNLKQEDFIKHIELIYNNLGSRLA